MTLGRRDSSSSRCVRAGTLVSALHTTQAHVCQASCFWELLSLAGAAHTYVKDRIQASQTPRQPQGKGPLGCEENERRGNPGQCQCCLSQCCSSTSNTRPGSQAAMELPITVRTVCSHTRLCMVRYQLKLLDPDFGAWEMLPRPYSSGLLHASVARHGTGSATPIPCPTHPANCCTL